MNLVINDGTRPNPTRKLTPINTMANTGYKPSQGGRPNFIPLNAGELIKKETDKNPSRKDLRFFATANIPDPTMEMRPCKSHATIDIINGRLKRQQPIKNTNGMYPVPYSGGRNQPIGLAQEQNQMISKLLNGFNSDYPNMKTPIGIFPN
jgi:hypothetical protein